MTTSHNLTPETRSELVDLLDNYMAGQPDEAENPGEEFMAFLAEHGLAVVPVEPTAEMVGAAMPLMNVRKQLMVAIAASPYRREA